MPKFLKPAFISNIELRLGMRSIETEPDGIEYVFKVPAGSALKILTRIPDARSVKSVQGFRPAEVDTFVAGPWAIFINEESTYVTCGNEMLSLTECVLEAFGGGVIKRKGKPNRGGQYEVHLKGVAPSSLADTSEAVKRATARAGFIVQGDTDFPTTLVEDGAPGYFVERGEWTHCLIKLAGTAKRPYLIISG